MYSRTAYESSCFLCHKLNKLSRHQAANKRHTNTYIYKYVYENVCELTWLVCLTIFNASIYNN